MAKYVGRARTRVRDLARLRKEAYEIQRGLCFYCGQRMSVVTVNEHGHSDEDISSDHLYPQIEGGADYGNIVACHRMCNNDKGNREPTLEEIERYREIFGRQPTPPGAHDGVIVYSTDKEPSGHFDGLKGLLGAT